MCNPDPRVSEPNETLDWEQHLGEMCCLPHRPLRDILNVAVKCLHPSQPVKLDGQTWFKSFHGLSIPAVNLEFFCLLLFVN